MNQVSAWFALGLQHRGVVLVDPARVREQQRVEPALLLVDPLRVDRRRDQRDGQVEVVRQRRGPGLLDA
jgi:hypothetical protein